MGKQAKKKTKVSPEAQLRNDQARQFAVDLVDLVEKTTVELKDYAIPPHVKNNSMGARVLSNCIDAWRLLLDETG